MHALCFVVLAGLSGLPYTTSQSGFDFGLVTRTTTKTGPFYAPDPGLDPYWVGGEWVFGNARLVSATTRQAVQSGRLLVCGRPCARVFRKLTGQVCVHKLDNVYSPSYDGKWQGAWPQGFIDWRLGGVLDRNYDYLRDFPSYCAFLDAQCRSNVAHGYGYAFLHMGKCLKDSEAFPNLLDNVNMPYRKRKYIQDYKVQVYYPDHTNARACHMKGAYGDYYHNKIRESGNCYWVSTIKANWNTAKWYCKDRHADLLVLDDENERRVILDVMQRNYAAYEDYTRLMFIGITADANRVWHTHEGDSVGLLDDVGYAPWAPGEPNNWDGIEYCAAVDKLGSAFYYDVPCRYAYSFICKKRVDSEIVKYT